MPLNIIILILYILWHICVLVHYDNNLKCWAIYNQALGQKGMKPAVGL